MEVTSPALAPPPLAAFSLAPVPKRLAAVRAGFVHVTNHKAGISRDKLGYFLKTSSIL
jgi:hypothetical protein